MHTLYTILSKLSSESKSSEPSELSSKLSSSCFPFPEVTRVLVSYGVSTSVYSVPEVDVDMDFGLYRGVVMLLFVSSCSFSSFGFCGAQSQCSISLTALSCSLKSLSSSSEFEQSDLRGMGYSLQHCFPVGLNILQYPGDFHVWLDMVNDSWVVTAGTVAGCVIV